MAPAIPVSFAGHKDSKKRLFSEMTGKARRFSRGPSSGFVPDYRHGLENTVDYEGIGSSAQIDTAMTASEDSFATKRRSFSLNADRCGSYGIQKEVFPSSRMSRAERKDLIYKLRMELELVQELRQKLASVVPDVVMVSPNSDIQTFSGDRRASRENLGRPMYSQNKKRPAARIDKLCQKKGTAMRPYPAGTTSMSIALVMKQCETLLNRLLSHQYAWVFNAPVDPVKLNIPDYFTVIKHPMDLGTVKRRLETGEYVSPSEFAADVRLTFSNAMTYNPPSNDVHGMAKTLSKYFETRWRSIEKKISVIVQPLAPSIGSGFMVSGTTANLPSTVEKVMVENKVKSEPPGRVMTDEEKKRLNAELEPLLEELPENIVDFLKEQSIGDGQSGEDEIEIDIDALSHETLFKLRKLLDDYLLDKQNSQAKVEPCEMEIIHDSGFSNSPVQPGGEEDVDILGGNDPPVTSRSFVSMEKQSAQRIGNGSSSSSSGSESGSSSNDADSDSSSGSEAGNAKGSTTPGAAKASTTPGAAKASTTSGAAKALLSSSVLTDKMVSGENVEETANEELLDGSKFVEFNSKEPFTSEADGCKEGEEISAERQISPEKQYRAALLKNRFADTILKAREKALDKGEKRDPEKLRIEREELERHRREEKARLQAEAKVAEEAKRKAEAKAAAHAKRKREQEREAARLALQQMEQTVDINGSSQFLQDLELLRAAARDEQPSNFMEETSPERSRNLMGSFKMPGMSNPLEQLGLYMKMDQDEEEEEEEDGEQPVLEKEASNLLQNASYQEVDGTTRNRGQESEASQQVEQTMDINRNNQFLEDLEMPRAASCDDQTLNSMEETSPERSQNMMGNFNMLGMSNPLEELGLYMKKDRDEEEEEEGEQQPFLETEASNQLQSASNLETEEGEREDGTDEVQEKGGLRNALEGREREKGGLMEYVLNERKKEIGLAKGEQEKDWKEEQQVNVAEDGELGNGVGREQQENVVVEDKDQQNGLERGHHQNNEGGQQENVVVEEEELKTGAENVEEKKVVEDGEQEMDVEKLQQENAVQMGEQKTVVEEIQQENAVEEGEQEGAMEEGKQDFAVEVKEQERDTEKEEQEIDVEEIYQGIGMGDEKKEQENDVEEGEQEGGLEERRDDGIEEMQKKNSISEMHQEDVVEEKAVEEGEQEGGMKEKQDDCVEEIQKENSVMVMHQQDVVEEIHQKNAVEEGEQDDGMEERQDDGMEEMQRENAVVMHREDVEEEIHQDNAAEAGVQEGGFQEEMEDYGMKETHQEDAIKEMHREDAIEEVHREGATEEVHREGTTEEVHQEGTTEEMHPEEAVEVMHPEDDVEEGEKEDAMVAMHQADILEETHPLNSVKEGEQKSCMEAEMQEDGMEESHQDNTGEEIRQESGMVEGRQDIDMEEGEQRNDVEEMKQETRVEEGSKE